MFCFNCGKELPEGAVFCGHCGAQQGGNAPTNDPSKTEASRKKSKKKLRKIIGITLLCLPIISIVAIYANGVLPDLLADFKENMVVNVVGFSLVPIIGLILLLKKDK